MLQIEFDFTLPCGFVDPQGNLHRSGVMRRATALDEIEPLADPRVRANEGYLVILLLSRVIVRLGSFTAVRKRSGALCSAIDGLPQTVNPSYELRECHPTVHTSPTIFALPWRRIRRSWTAPRAA